MIILIAKILVVICLYIFVTGLLWCLKKGFPLNTKDKILIGILFGVCSIISNHYGVSYSNMIINIRDVGPLIAGLFFSPLSGVIAGLISGIERYIAGTYFGVGSFTTIACSISTCLSGFVALILNIKIFKGKKPSPFYAFFMGAVMEVFHMYVVFITHRNDMRMAFQVVKTCAIPMITFTGLCLALSSIMLQSFDGEFVSPFIKRDEEKISVSQKFQRQLFAVTVLVIIGNSIFSFLLQTQSATQICNKVLMNSTVQIEKNFTMGYEDINLDSNVLYSIVDKNGWIIKGQNKGATLSEAQYKSYLSNTDTVFRGTFDGSKSLIITKKLEGDYLMIAAMKEDEVYWYRNAEAYENALSDLMLFTVLYVLIAYLVDIMVVNNILRINKSLGKITAGNLNEVVSVRGSSEFATLSDDINHTVDALKGYIDAAEKKIEEELILARTIQLSSLPNVFSFPEIKEFSLYAKMNPAKEVGGDFYDFFFVEMDKLALVIADVSGKGIPASLFMMRSKTAIRSLAESGASPEEIIFNANNQLCDGNEAEMFVTVWVGIINLSTGVMQCANAGHEYPIIRRAGGDYELFKEKHSPAVGTIPNIKAKGYELKLEPGDRLFLYTDGVPEAINEEVEQFGTRRMVDTLNSIKELPINQTIDYMSSTLNSFKGSAEQFDDITMLGFDFTDYFSIKTEE